MISLHRVEPGAWLHPGQEADPVSLAHDLAAWRSCYRRTVLQDALEHLHAQASGGG
ncbi:hypothetical protein SRB17_44170 [Streptomyces sp. RB17]|uniref:hypothetical protein n=1 Tax=Streptomyces sp. RB17 TaxID=2585197 RepID=UPI0012958FE2|nr:hypothetical protein [Streptomyces sp. RB17]MQY36416.1 hypothetical protein [Streptomyces sp. RB17]